MKTSFIDSINPAWYEFYPGQKGSIHFAIHRMALEHMKNEPWASAPIVPEFKKRYQLDSFTPPGEHSCGFNEVFRLINSDRPEWVVFELVLPRMKVVPGVIEDSTHYVMAVRATLNVFLGISLWLFEEITDALDPQLIIVEGICLPVDDHRTRCNGALSVTLSPHVIRWITKQPEGHCQQIIDAMKEASDWMWYNNCDRGRFGARIRKPKWLHLSVPGDACDLDPGSRSDENSLNGYALEPHNVDSSLQQLTFFAGIAKLHQLVREDMRNSVS